jgi:hypothetical protein
MIFNPFRGSKSGSETAKDGIKTAYLPLFTGYLRGISVQTMLRVERGLLAFLFVITYGRKCQNVDQFESRAVGHLGMNS